RELPSSWLSRLCRIALPGSNVRAVCTSATSSDFSRAVTAAILMASMLPASVTNAAKDRNHPDRRRDSSENSTWFIERGRTGIERAERVRDLTGRDDRGSTGRELFRSG